MQLDCTPTPSNDPASAGFFVPEVFAPGEGLVKVAAAPHPFKAARQVIGMQAGLTLADMLDEVQPDPLLRGYAHISVNGYLIPRKNWRLVRPKAGAEVTIRVVPQDGGGGGGKDLRTTLLQIAVLALAIATPFALGLQGTLAGALLGAGVGIVGALTIRALVPPGSQSSSDLSDQTRSSPTLSGARNEMRPYGVVPVVLGRHRVFPPLAAPPFTEIVGNSQWLRMLFCVGEGPLNLSQLKIGNTKLEKFNGVRTGIRRGLPGDSPIRLFPKTVTEEPLQIKLTKSAGWRQRRTEPGTDQISVDIAFPIGLQRTNAKTGDRDPLTVDVEVEYKRLGAASWSVGSAGTAFGARLSGNMPEPAQITKRGADDTWVFGQEQIFRIAMDPQSGKIETIAGEAVRAFLISGPVHSNPDLQEPDPPQWPDRKIRIAQVLRRTGDATIGSNRITDKRNGANALPPLSSFSLSTDFLPGPDSPASNKIEIAAGTLIFSGFSIRAKTPKTLRRSLLIDIPDEDRGGQFDVRLKRITNDRAATESDGDTNQDLVFWTALRSIDDEPPVNPDRANKLALIALRIKATNQLNGVLDSFNCVAESVLPDWDGTSWVERPTRNPASIFRAVLQGVGHARPLADARLDLVNLQDWHEYCEDEGWTFDMVRDFPSTIPETLIDVAASGRAAPSVKDGLHGVVIDRLQSVPVQHFTPRNSFGFQGAKAFPDLPHGFRVRFADKDKRWKQRELVIYRDGFNVNNATKIEGLDLPGVTDKVLARRHARLHLAQAELRPEIWSFSTDVESLVATRGDLIKLTHDVILAGLASGRIKGVTVDGGGDVTSLDLDEVVPMEAGKTYAIAIRTLGDANVVGTVITNPGEQTTVTLSPVIPAASAPAVGDIFGFGESGLETIEAIIKSIEPGPDLTFRLACVSAAPALHSADTGLIPEFDPGISEPIGFGKPAVESIRSDELVLIRGGDGALRSRILVTLFRPSGLPDSVTGIEAAIREQPGDTFEPDEDWSPFLLSRDATEVSFGDVEDGDTYEFRLRYVFSDNTPGEWTQVFTETVVGKSTLPPAPTSFRLERFGGKPFVVWSYDPPADFGSFEIRHRSGTLAQWEGAEQLPDNRILGNKADISDLPGGLRTFMIRAVDLAGNLSALVSATLHNAQATTQILAVEEFAPDWDGTLTGGTVAGGVIRATDQGSQTPTPPMVERDLGLMGIGKPKRGQMTAKSEQGLAGASAALYLPNDNEPYLTNDGTGGRTDDAYLPTVYDEMVFTRSFVPAVAPARALASFEGVFAGLELSYRNGGHEAYLPDAIAAYLETDADLYLPAPTEFAPWLDGLEVARERMDLRLTTPEGNVASRVNSLDLTLDSV
jgi:hypothetical protein